MQKINALIIDDEKDSRETLHNYLGKYCPSINILTECSNIEEARAAIIKHQPQLIFLDIEMPRGNAFDLLEQWEDIDFEIIFVTAFSEYALRAFHLSAAHYLLKPVDIEKLEEAVEIVTHRINSKEQLSHAKILLDNLTAVNNQHRKLVLPLLEGFDIVKMSEVLYCEAQDNFTCFYFIDKRKSLICRRLKFYETALKEFGFCRVHRSFLVNLEYVKRYLKGKGGSVILEDGTEIMVANNRKTLLMDQLRGS